MKIDWNHKYTTIAVYAFLVVAASILFFNFVSDLDGVSKYFGFVTKLITPFIYGGVIAYILNPVLHWLECDLFPMLFKDKVQMRNRRRLSVLLSVLFAMLVVALFFAIVIPQISDSIRRIAISIPTYIQTLNQLMNDLIVRYGTDDVTRQILSTIGNSTETIFQKGYELLSQGVPLVATWALKITGSIMDLAVGLIISVYALLSKETFAAQIKKLLFAFFPENFARGVLTLAHDSNQIFCGFISGKILDSCIIGLICFVGMSVLNMPYAMLVSVIVGVTNVIPYFGPFIGAIPSVLLIFIVNPLQALYFAIFILLLQQLDGNVIGPKILGDSTGLSAFWVIFAVTFFGGMFGFVGMLIGVPTFAVIYSLVRRFSEFCLQKRGLATQTAAYASEESPIIQFKEPKKEKKPQKHFQLPKK